MVPSNELKCTPIIRVGTHDARNNSSWLINNSKLGRDIIGRKATTAAAAAVACHLHVDPFLKFVLSVLELVSIT